MSLINDKLGGDESLLETLYHFLEQDPPLNPLLASFFSKTIGNLIARKTEQVTSSLLSVTDTRDSGAGQPARLDPFSFVEAKILTRRASPSR